MLHKNAGLGDGQSVIEKVIDLLLKFQTSHGKTSGSSVISQECPADLIPLSLYHTIFSIYFSTVIHNYLQKNGYYHYQKDRCNSFASVSVLNNDADVSFLLPVPA